MYFMPIVRPLSAHDSDCGVLHLPYKETVPTAGVTALYGMVFTPGHLALLWIIKLISNEEI
jgi:hypothetical protein